MTTLHRLPLETELNHVERVLLSELYRGATDAEIAAFCGVTSDFVRRVRLSMTKSAEIVRLLAAAERLCERVEYEAGPLALLWGCLASFRIANRERLRTRPQSDEEAA